MKSDIQIAQECTMEPIIEVAKKIGLTEDDLELYGKYKAKVSLNVWERVKDRPNGKLVLVTAINPTPAGEGKTTTTVGLGQALNRIGKTTVIALRGGTFPGAKLRSKGWCCRRRLFSGSTYGRY